MRGLLSLGIAGLLLAGATRLEAVDFIRGDANSDGVVTFSDVHYLLNYLFRGGTPAECRKAADVEGDGNTNIADPIWLVGHLVFEGPTPAAPYPSPGPDPTDSGLSCDSYGNGSPLEDPAAKMEILDAVAPGGTDGKAVITIAVSSSDPIAGYFGSITAQPELFLCVGQSPADLTGTADRDLFSGAKKGLETANTNVRFGFLCSLKHQVSIPAGQDVSALEISVCLTPGTPAGEYPLTLAAAELVDAASGRAVPPLRVDGVLQVLAEVTDSGGSCADQIHCEDPEDPEDPPTPLPEDIDSTFKLGSARTRPGSTVAMPFYVRATTELQGAATIWVQAFSFSVDFDEEVLEILQVDPVFQKPDGTPYDFSQYQLNSENKTPGSGGIDEGFVTAAAVFELEDPEKNMLPGDTESPVVNLEFLVRQETQVTGTEIRFLAGAHTPEHPPVDNTITIIGRTNWPEAFNSFLFINGYIDVLPDISTFVRGDSNGDDKVDISDAQYTLGFLFLGSTEPYCHDAADANDSGLVDISDAVYTLGYLFLGGSSLPQPYPEMGEDPTEDAMDCSGLTGS